MEDKFVEVWGRQGNPAHQSASGVCLPYHIRIDATTFTVTVENREYETLAKYRLKKMPTHKQLQSIGVPTEGEPSNYRESADGSVELWLYHGGHAPFRVDAQRDDEYFKRLKALFRIKTSWQ